MAAYVTPIEITGNEYPRASRMECINSDPPEVRVYVADRQILSTGEVKDINPVQLDHVMTDPSLPIPWINPETYEPTELTFTAGEFQLMAASVAMWRIRQYKGIPDTPIVVEPES